MNNSADEHPALRERFAEAFSRLPEQDIEQFYAQYQLWLLRRRVPVIQKQLEALDEHLAENQQAIQSFQPSAIALAVLVRLQANGVSNIELLDQMLERGEDWLDRMMQRLDYCEQVQDFIQGDYTQWCYRSLEGAYDWIDTLLGSVKEGEEPRPPLAENSEATEELLLQKLRLDDEEEMLASTLKGPTVMDAGEKSALETSDQEEIPLSVAEQFLMAGSIAEEQSEGSIVAEQPLDLANWKDLEAPEERPVPWYSVNLASDASDAPAQPEEMDEWIKALEVDDASAGGSGGGDVIVDNVSVQSEETSRAESEEYVLQAEPVEMIQESRAQGTGVEEEETPVIEEASNVAEPEAMLERQLPGETNETEERLAVEHEAVTASTLSQEEYQDDEITRPADGSEAAQAPVDSGITVDGTPGNAEEEASGGESAEITSADGTAPESAGLQEVEREEISRVQAEEEQGNEAGHEIQTEQQSEVVEVVVDETAQETAQGGELPDEPAMPSMQPEIASADLQDEALVEAEEERPWYEYLDLKEPVAREQSEVEQPPEPGKPHLLEPEGSTDAQTISADREDDTTQPMALRDIQLTRGQARLGETEGMQPAASEPAASEVSNLQVSVEPGQQAPESQEVRETISFTGQEPAGLPEPMEEQVLQTNSTREKRASASQPVQHVPLPSQHEEPPKKHGFWRRLFAWLRGK